MSEKLFAPFRIKSDEATRFQNLWHALDERIYHELSTLYQSRPDDPSCRSALERLDAERQQMTSTLQRALQQLFDSLCRPELVLATAGTTSSGKSALVNLLCGAEIMPVAFDEMSAGVVSIIHGPSRTLTIHDTPGAVWETGTWTGLSDEDICNRLREVMRSYHRRRQEVIEGLHSGTEPPACPRSELEYPTYLGNHPELLDLPKCCRFRILDLPGLKYVGDESNSRVIRESREALCFVTYNSYETDPVKQARLLEQVVDQVKELGGSPARMLFILNRIDALRLDDKEWPHNETAFVTRMKDEITKTLAARLPEYANSITNLCIVRLSTLPALYSLHLMTGHPEQLRAARELDNHFNSLIPNEVKDDLPRRVEKWSPHQCQRVGEEVWKTSYAHDYFKMLRDHVHTHFPDLVLPQITDRFKSEAGAHVAEWFVQTASAELNSSQERYDAECKRLSSARVQLEQLCEESDRLLRQPFDRIRSILADSRADTRTIFDAIRDTLNKLQEHPPFHQLPPDRLKPLSHWQEELARKRSQTIETIACILERRDDVPQDVFDNLPGRHVHAWHTAVRKLIDSGYTSNIARCGGHIETRDKNEKQRLRNLNQALNHLAQVLSPLLQHVMEQAASREQKRVFESVQQLIDLYWKDVTERAQLQLEKLGLTLNLTAPTVNLKQHEQDLTLAYQFVAKAHLGTTTRTEDTGRTEKVQVGTTRRWYTLWLYKHPVYANRPIYEERTYDTADIPSATQLLESWDRHAREQEPALVRQFIDWIFRQLDQASQALKKSQQDLLDRYQVKLDEARDVARQSHIDSQKIWLPLLEQAQELHQCLERLCRTASQTERNL
ncbi:MAG: dynamin family protein [Acidobacteriota bacterium]|nr:dynamin family protein [Acidobacteriota bacterium]